MQLRNLKRLDLYGCLWVNGKALAVLSSIRSLEELNICFTPACVDIANLEKCFFSRVKTVSMNIEYQFHSPVYKIIDQRFCIFPGMVSLKCYLPVKVNIEKFLWQKIFSLFREKKVPALKEVLLKFIVNDKDSGKVYDKKTSYPFRKSDKKNLPYGFVIHPPEFTT